VAQTHVWKGETTYLVGDDATMTWMCWQGMSMRTAVPTATSPANFGEIVGGTMMVPYAQCVSTIVQNQGSSVRVATKRYNKCYFYRHMIPLVVQMGETTWKGGSEETEEMDAVWESKLSRMGCDSDGASRTMWAGGVNPNIAAVGTGPSFGASNGSTNGSGGRMCVEPMSPTICIIVGHTQQYLPACVSC